MNIDRFDDFPAPRRSPRLYAEVEAVPHSRRMSEVVGSRTSEARLRRLRHMAIIEACRNAPNPVPYSTLISTLGISRSNAVRLYKMACTRKMRQSRV